MISKIMTGKSKFISFVRDIGFICYASLDRELAYEAHLQNHYENNGEWYPDEVE
jgi:hypothetical protein